MKKYHPLILPQHREYRLSMIGLTINLLYGSLQARNSDALHTSPVYLSKYSQSHLRKYSILLSQSPRITQMFLLLTPNESSTPALSPRANLWLEFYTTTF